METTHWILCLALRDWEIFDIVLLNYIPEIVYIPIRKHCRTDITYFNQQLVEGGAAAQDLLKRFKFFIIPVLNPDGYVYTWTDVSTVLFSDSISVILIHFLPSLATSHTSGKFYPF